MNGDLLMFQRSDGQFIHDDVQHGSGNRSVEKMAVRSGDGGIRGEGSVHFCWVFFACGEVKCTSNVVLVVLRALETILEKLSRCRGWVWGDIGLSVRQVKE
jgi:hypothetical protein